MNKLNQFFVDDLMEGLSANGLDNSYTHLLTGYVGNGSFLRNLANVAKRLKEKNPRLIFGNIFFFNIIEIKSSFSEICIYEKLAM